MVDRDKLITGERITAGDVLIGLPSSGLHSNGYSLVRKICFERKKLAIDYYVPGLNRTLGEELLVPTRLYPKVCLPILERFVVHGMVHVTGGGFYDNIPRMLPAGCSAEVDCTTWPRPAIFDVLQKWGGVAWPEMYRTFNMGIGMILAVPASQADAIVQQLAEQGEAAYIIGKVTTGTGDVVIKGGAFGE